MKVQIGVHLQKDMETAGTHFGAGSKALKGKERRQYKHVVVVGEESETQRSLSKDYPFTQVSMSILTAM